MTPSRVDELLQHIDAVIGPPDRETPEQKAERRKEMERRARRRELLRGTK